jgi:hypothetical protein
MLSSDGSMPEIRRRPDGSRGVLPAEIAEAHSARPTIEMLKDSR